MKLTDIITTGKYTIKNSSLILHVVNVIHNKAKIGIIAKYGYYVIEKPKWYKNINMDIVHLWEKIK